MNYIFKNANVYIDGCFKNTDIVVENGSIVSFNHFQNPMNSTYTIFDFNNKYIFPGFVDAHVHLREPGFSYKETIKTGTLAAARGGYTSVCTMPNLNPVPDSIENLNIQIEIINKDAVINVLPCASITKKQNGTELVNFKQLSPFVAGFSDDGRGVQNDEILEQAMVECAKLNKIIVSHCEDESLVNGGYIHKGSYAQKNNHKGISSESEWKAVERDINLAQKTKCPYHVCHVSTKESVNLIRNAKKSGINITCETAPHYLIFSDMDLQESGNFKMNPPIRSEEDKFALLEGIKDGTIDMISTDHAPHSEEEKSKGLKGSPFGIVGLETAFPVLFTNLVKTSFISLEKLIEILHTNSSNRFKIGTNLKIGEVATLTVFDLNHSYKIDSSNFLSLGKSTPFNGMEVFGKCIMTMYNGKIIYNC